MCLQQIQRSSKRTAKRLTPQKIGRDCQGQLVEVADELFGIGEVGCLVDAAGDVAEVDAREGVDFSRVAAYREGLGDDGGHLHEICGKGRCAVFVDGAEGAAVPGFALAIVFVLAVQDGTSCLGCVHGRECMITCHRLLQ